MVNKGKSKNRRVPNPDGYRDRNQEVTSRLRKAELKRVELTMRNGPGGLIDTASIGQIEL